MRDALPRQSQTRAPARLHWSLARRLVFLQPQAAQLGESLEWTVETAQNCFAILDRESDEFLLGLQRDDKCLGGVLESDVIEQPSEIEHVLVAYRIPREPHHRRCYAASALDEQVVEIARAVRGEPPRVRRADVRPENTPRGLTLSHSNRSVRLRLAPECNQQHGKRPTNEDRRQHEDLRHAPSPISASSMQPSEEGCKGSRRNRVIGLAASCELPSPLRRRYVPIRRSGYRIGHPFVHPRNDPVSGEQSDSSRGLNLPAPRVREVGSSSGVGNVPRMIGCLSLDGPHEPH